MEHVIYSSFLIQIKFEINHSQTSLGGLGWRIRRDTPDTRETFQITGSTPRAWLLRDETERFRKKKKIKNRLNKLKRFRLLFLRGLHGVGTRVRYPFRVGSRFHGSEMGQALTGAENFFGNFGRSTAGWRGSLSGARPPCLTHVEATSFFN